MAYASTRVVLLSGLVLGLAVAPALAQPSLPGPVPVPVLQPSLHTTTTEGYRAHVEQLRDLVSACRQNASGCDSKAVGEDDKIEPAGAADAGAVQVRWQWLRSLMDDARDGGLKDRGTLLDQATSRLDEESAEASPSTPQSEPGFAPARRAADAILASPEFRIVTKESWWDRKLAQFWNLLNRLFGSAYDFGHRSPWLAPLLEWGFVALVLTVVLVWVQRTMQRQRLAVALGSQPVMLDWQKESADWAERARAQADSGNWREAIHCLYWASIVALESRRLWRRDYARTPREYLRLLESGSPQQSALRALTRIFERIWYGLRSAVREDYDRALALFEDLRRA